MSRGIMKALTPLVLIAIFILLIGTACASTIITPNGLETIGAEAFSGDAAIPRVVVQSGTAAIRSRAFADSGLAQLLLPDTVTYIASDAFAGCGAIEVLAEAGSYGHARVKTLMSNGAMKGNLYDVFSLCADGYVSGPMAAGEVFYILFTAPRSDSYSFYGISTAGTYADMYDIYGTDLGHDDNSYDGMNFCMTRSLEKGERVLLRTRLDSADATGYISSNVEAGTAPKPVTIAEGIAPVTVPGGGYARYRFTAPVSSYYEVGTDEPLNGCIGIRDTYGDLVGFSDDDHDGCDHATRVYLEANERVYIDVINDGNEAVTRNLNIARTVFDLSIGGNEHLTVAGENRLYRFTAETEGSYTFYSIGSRETCATLYDENMNRIAGGGSDFRNFGVVYEMSAGETVFLDARFGDAAYEGNMRIEVCRTRPGDVAELEFGVNSVCVDAGEIASCVFVAPVTATYTFTSTGGEDTYASLYRADGKLIKYDDDSGSGNNFSITTELTKGCGVSLDVSYYTATVFGDMNIYVVIPAVGMGDNSVSVAPGKVTYSMFTAPSAGTYIFRSTGSEDVLGYLLKTDGTLVRCDDGGDDENYSIAYSCAAGETLLLGTGYSKSSLRGTVTVNISVGDDPVETGTDYRALIVRNYDYPGSFDDLPECANDGTKMNSILGRINGGAYAGNITMLSNASSDGVLNQISSIAAQADFDDVTLFYYTGHGCINEGTNSGALCMADDWNDMITTSRLAEALSAIPGKVIVIVDSCGSGALVQNGDEDEADTFDPEAFDASVISAFAAVDSVIVPEAGDAVSNSGEFAADSNTKFYVLTASAKGEYSWTDSTLGMSAFTRWLTWGLGLDKNKPEADSNRDSRITLKELYTYVRSKSNAAKFRDPRTGEYLTMHPQVYPANSSSVLFTK